MRRKRPLLERQRQAAIVAAQDALLAYEKAQAPKLAEAARKKKEAIAKLKADLKAYEATTFAKKMADWEKEKTSSILNRWLVVEPKTLSATNGSTLTRQPDGSVIASGSNRNGIVTITAETDLTGITGFRLEVLADSHLPQKGPGRAADGNFVLNEIELTVGPKADPKEAKPVKLANAMADFNQDNLSVSKAIDGKLPDDPGNGWAIHPATGVTHWAGCSETLSPIGGPGTTTLTVKPPPQIRGRLDSTGRFRFSITRGPKPVGLSLPEDFRAILATFHPRSGLTPRRPC